MSSAIFVKEFLQGCFSHVRLSSELLPACTPQALLLRMLDNPLYHTLFSPETLSQYKRFLPSLEENFQEAHTLCLVTDAFYLNYILLPLDGQILMTAPFLSTQPSIPVISAMIQDSRIPESFHTFLEQYFSTLPLITDISFLYALLESAGSMLYGASCYTVRHILWSPQMSPVYASYNERQVDPSNAAELKLRYETENRLLDCIGRGDQKGAEEAISSPYFTHMEERMANTLRNRKNSLIILNSLFRKTAEQHGVHPIYLDALSRRIALKIEQMNSTGAHKQLQHDMVRHYCLLVQQNTASGCSPVIRDIIHEISVNPSARHSLTALAEKFHVSRGYLSTAFRRETGMVLTDYVNEAKLDRAIFLMNSTELGIGDIGAAVGIPDLSYFSRLFRRKTGKSPSVYRKEIRSH